MSKVSFYKQCVITSWFALTSIVMLGGSASAEDSGVYGYWKHVDEETGKTQSIFKLFEYQGKSSTWKRPTPAELQTL